MSAGKSLLRSAAADEGWAKTFDRPARTANARKTFLDRFEEEAVRLAAEQGVKLTPEALAKCATSLRSAHFKRLADKSVAVRKARSLRSRIPADGGAE